MIRVQIYRTAILVVGLFAATRTTVAQPDAYVISQQSFVRLIPLYQHWSVGSEMAFSQLGVGLSAYAPLSQELGLTVHAAHVTTTGDVTSLGGLADTKLSLNYYIEKPGVVLSCGVSLPTGKSELTQEEFETSLLISNDVFDLQTPNVGQGLTIQPGLAWAASFGDNLSIGAGASYHYRAKYKPLAEYGDYDPGDELLLTAGIDVRLGETSSLAADVVFTKYGADKLDEEDVFASGSRISTNVQFRKSIGQHELLISTRYRSLSVNDIAIAGALVAEEGKVAPNLLDVSGRFHLRVSGNVSVSLFAEGRFYQETASTLSGVNLFGVGLAPEIQVSSHMTIPARVKFQFGKLKNGDSITGMELGLGIAVMF